MLTQKWESGDVKGRHGCGLWKLIMRGKVDFWKFIRFSLSSGFDISFWEDLWIGDLSLKEGFNSLFRLARNPRVSVGNSFDSMHEVWSPSLCRNVND